MLPAKFLLWIIVGACLAQWIEGIDKKQSCTAERKDSTVYFGLILSYPDPLGRKALAAGFDDGHDIAPAAYLAVERINNRSDLLSDYQVELTPFDGGCNVKGRTVVGIGNLAHSCKPIVGIVGPSCEGSADLVGQFTGRDQFSMVTIHYGEGKTFENKEKFPFAFGILGANFLTVQAFTDIILRNSWKRVVLLGNFLGLMARIEQNIKKVESFDIVFASPIYDYFIPLLEVRQSFARVIILFSSAKISRHTLCLAFHEGMVFPKYQWVFNERFESEFTETSFTYRRKRYSCTQEDINTSIYGSISLVWSLGSDETVDDSLDKEYKEGYEEQRNVYVNEFNESSVPVEWAAGIYDAVWSLAFALNDSLEVLNMNLTQVVPGSKAVAQAIANHMPDIDFQGVSGRIHFDNKSGFNTARHLNIYQFKAANSSTLIGFYASRELVIFNDTKPLFIKATFDEKYIRVSTAVAVPILILRVVMLLLIVAVQIINIAYRHRPSIKSTSPKLNHIIFLGFYLTVVGMVLHTIAEVWPQILKSNTCKALPWFLSIGTTLVLGTVCAKTWRLYYIYTSGKKGVRISSKRIRDPILGGLVGAFVAVDVLLCLLWTCIDSLRVSETVAESKASLLITVTVSCESRWPGYWTGALIFYKCVLILCSFLLAFPTRLSYKELQTNNVIVLSYILTVAVGLGVPMYAVISIVDVGVWIRFVVASVFVDTMMYICLFALFLPSVTSLILRGIRTHK